MRIHGEIKDIRKIKLYWDICKKVKVWGGEVEKNR